LKKKTSATVKISFTLVKWRTQARRANGRSAKHADRGHDAARHKQASPAQNEKDEEELSNEFEEKMASETKKLKIFYGCDVP